MNILLVLLTNLFITTTNLGGNAATHTAEGWQTSIPTGQESLTRYEWRYLVGIADEPEDPSVRTEPAAIVYTAEGAVLTAADGETVATLPVGDYWINEQNAEGDYYYLVVRSTDNGNGSYEGSISIMTTDELDQQKFVRLAVPLSSPCTNCFRVTINP